VRLASPVVRLSPPLALARLGRAIREKRIMVLDRETQTTLLQLRWHWDDAYKIDTDGDTWSASPLWDRTRVIIAESPGELKEKLQHDYARHQSPSGGCSV